jgi:WD40 repeat protein
MYLSKLKTAAALLAVLLTAPVMAALADDKSKDEAPSAASPDGKEIAAGNDKAIIVYDALTGREIRKMAGHADKVTAVAYSPDGKRLVSGSADKTVQMWDVPTGKVLWKFTGNDAVKSIAFSPDGKTVTVLEGEKKTRNLDTATGKILE